MLTLVMMIPVSLQKAGMLECFEVFVLKCLFLCGLSTWAGSPHVPAPTLPSLSPAKAPSSHTCLGFFQSMSDVKAQS